NPNPCSSRSSTVCAQVFARMASRFCLIALATLLINGQKPLSNSISPRDSVIYLFNGKDLTSLYPWLKESQYADPRHVFSITNGILRISGESDGYLATEKSYQNYHLVLEYKWGT